MQHAIVDTGFLGIDLSDNGCLSSVCIASSLTITMNNATNTVHWTEYYAEKAKRLFNLEKAINSSFNSTKAYINNTRLDK